MSLDLDLDGAASAAAAVWSPAPVGWDGFLIVASCLCDAWRNRPRARSIEVRVGVSLADLWLGRRRVVDLPSPLSPLVMSLTFRESEVSWQEDDGGGRSRYVFSKRFPRRGNLPWWANIWPELRARRGDVLLTVELEPSPSTSWHLDPTPALSVFDIHVHVPPRSVVVDHPGGLPYTIRIPEMSRRVDEKNNGGEEEEDDMLLLLQVRLIGGAGLPYRAGPGKRLFRADAYVHIRPPITEV